MIFICPPMACVSIKFAWRIQTVMTAKSRYNTVIFPQLPTITSWHGNAFRITGPVWGEPRVDFPTVGPIILSRNCINFVVYSKQVVEQKVELLLVIWGAMNTTVCSQKTPIRVIWEFKSVHSLHTPIVLLNAMVCNFGPCYTETVSQWF